LHTEFADFVPPEMDAEVVILAGDIGVGAAGVRWAARHFPVRPVIYVPGNHEFYGHDIDLTAELRSAAPENITVLSDDVLVLDGVRFLGSTLWTDFKLHGEGEAWFARERAKRSMNDFVRIRQGGRKFRPEDSVVLHDFGVWPDPDRIDKAKRDHDCAGDFPVWFAENRVTAACLAFWVKMARGVPR
jgi:hypothetical protein